MTIWGFRGRRSLLRMRQTDWHALVAELGARGRGRIESGAFLLADQGGDQRLVTRVVYYDDLDPHCLQGGIHFDGLAYSKLWELCRSEHRTVVGDVHTHPGTWVEQSDIDSGSPMVAQKDHIALIVPEFSLGPVAPHQVGVHRYDGREWTSWTGTEAAQRLFVRRLL